MLFEIISIPYDYVNLFFFFMSSYEFNNIVLTTNRVCRTRIDREIPTVCVVGDRAKDIYKKKKKTERKKKRKKRRWLRAEKN